jgi:hypothetical protein
MLSLQDLVEDSETAPEAKLYMVKLNRIHEDRVSENFHQAPMAGNTR